MKLEDQVVSFELAKRLKELWVKQESIFYYMNHLSNKSWKNSVRYPDGSDPRYWDFDNKISAFTVAELGEMLPTDNYQIYLGAECEQFNIGFQLNVAVRGQSWEDARRGFSVAATEANARAKMLIYLIENNLVKP